MGSDEKLCLMPVTSMDFYSHGAGAGMMTASFIRNSEGTRFRLDTSHVYSLVVLPTNNPFHGTEEVLPGIKALKVLLTLKGFFEYVAEEAVSHA